MPREQERDRHPEALLDAVQVQELFGGISKMTLHRWLGDDRLAFPRPIRVHRRRFWKERELLDWIARREAA